MKSISSEVISNLQIHLFCLNIPDFSVIHCDAYDGAFSTQNAPEEVSKKSVFCFFFTSFITF